MLVQSCPCWMGHLVLILVFFVVYLAHRPLEVPRLYCLLGLVAGELSGRDRVRLRST